MPELGLGPPGVMIKDNQRQEQHLSSSPGKPKIGDETRFVQGSGVFPLKLIGVLRPWRTTGADGDLLGNGIRWFRLTQRMEIFRIVVLHIQPARNSLEKTTTAFRGDEGVESWPPLLPRKRQEESQWLKADAREIHV